MNTIDFVKLSSRADGGYVLPVLITLSRPGYESWRFTNDNRDIQFEGMWYQAIPITYKPPSSRDGLPTGASIEIDLDQQQLIDSGGTEYSLELLKWFDEADDSTEAEVIIITKDRDTVSKIGHLRHKHGTTSWDGKTISWSFGDDDRMNMQVNPVTFDYDALTG